MKQSSEMQPAPDGEASSSENSESRVFQEKLQAETLLTNSEESTRTPGSSDISADRVPDLVNDPSDIAEEQLQAKAEAAGDKTEEPDEATLSATQEKLGPSLFCHKTQQSHGPLVEFGIQHCPACKTLLMPYADCHCTECSHLSELAIGKGARGRISLNPEKDNDILAKSKIKDDEEDKSKKTKTPGMEHNISLRENDGTSIAKEAWHDGPFEMTQPGTITKVDKASLILETLVVVVGTTYEGNFRYTSTPPVKELLDNPRHGFVYRETSLLIHSSAILQAINAVAPYDSRLSGTLPITLTEPYTVIGHLYTALEQYAVSSLASHVFHDSLGSTEQLENSSKLIGYPETSEHLNVLFKWLEGIEYQKRLQEEKERNAKGLCTFRMLWSLLKPGMTVCMNSRGVLGAYVISSVQLKYGSSRYMGSNTGVLSANDPERLNYTIWFWNLHFDGKFVGKMKRAETIPYFEGERAISSIKLVPIDMYLQQKGAHTQADLENWGEMWFKSLRGRQVYHRGRSLENSNIEVEGRAYIDPLGHHKEFDRSSLDDDYQYRPRNRYGEETEDIRCTCEQCKGMRLHPAVDDPWKEYDVIDPFVVDDLELPDNPHGVRHRYLVCDRVLWALMLKTRTWELIDVSGCSEIHFQENALDTLIMPSARKDLIKALVKKHDTKNPVKKQAPGWKADFVDGKGEGTIFLLHGSPGVGKTFVKCIAEFTRRPLIALTCADIGTDELKVEVNLSRWLNKAEQWNAVLLIDEADVFMEQRQINDLKRNSLVSVFLRCLEYYRGILFLTSNRVGHFDSAIISRIHIVIPYDPLGEDERRKIWDSFFKRLENDRRGNKFEITPSARSFVTGDDPSAIVKQSWNGREIRNAFQTAVALADFRAQESADGSWGALTAQDFADVCNMTKEFKEYLKALKGANEHKVAFEEGARYDSGKGAALW